jgi:2-aminoethylphosphonate-pyruvate transaminase|tara:strand:+ start:1666 stop:1911 length:246 start_codon:yes stop_codon:yes gene_type:complete
MLHDWGSRDKNFIKLNQSILESLVKLINGEDEFECVPMQGNGTFAVESMISSLISKNDTIDMHNTIEAIKDVMKELKIKIH